MAPKVLFELFSPREDERTYDLRTYKPNDRPPPRFEEIVPSPPKAESGVHIPKK